MTDLNPCLWFDRQAEEAAEFYAALLPDSHEDQAEVDRYWDALSAHPENEQCGWVKDRYGLSWQIIPRRLPDLLSDPARAERAMQAMLEMKQIDIARLEAAAGTA